MPLLRRGTTELPVETKAAQPLSVKRAQSRESISRLNERFVENLRQTELEVKEVAAEQHRPDSVGHGYYRYHVSRQNKPDLPDIIFRETKVSDNVYSNEMLVDKAKITEENQEAVSQELVAMAKALYASSGNKRLKVTAANDERLAIRLMAAALVAKMQPYLDENEFPEPAQRKAMEKQAYRMANLTPPDEEVRVGFRIENGI